MPIDFNPHVFNHPYPQIMQQQFYVQPQQTSDIFVKSSNINYDGMKVSKKSFGKIKKTQENADLYTITNKNGAQVQISTFGATIVSLKIPDKNGKLVDVVHGYNNVSPYEESPIGHAGGTIGPYANKINNGKFVLNDVEYNLECNKDNGKTHSHGANEGFDIKNWTAVVLKDGIKFIHNKKDMEGGYPGNLQTTVTYKLDNDNKLHIQYRAVSDKDTIINLTNHTYFNLDGAENYQENSILNHIVKIPNSDYITEVNEIGIPTGEFLNINNTPFDFKEKKSIREALEQTHPQIIRAKGFDQNYCINGYNGIKLIKAAEVISTKTGIKLNVLTNLPGFQFYTANNLGKASQPLGKNGGKYEKYSGLCIEPQFYPNAINTENFKDKGILKSGEIYNREIIYDFDVISD